MDLAMWENPDKLVLSFGHSDKKIRIKAISFLLEEINKLSKQDVHAVKENSSDPLDSDDDLEINESGDCKTIKITKEKDKFEPSGDALHDIQFFLPQLIERLSDPVEKCRELAYECLTNLVSRTSKEIWKKTLPNLIPTLINRLGQQELIESSEEVRLLGVNLLIELVDYLSKCKLINPFIDDFNMISSMLLTDPYHTVRIQTCQLIMKISQAVPDIFHYTAERLVPPLCRSIAHQQFRVRKAIVLCIGNVIKYGAHKSVEDVIYPLITRTSDASPTVRKCTVEVVGEWGLEFCDRYSHFHRFIPFILTGICDASPDVAATAEEYWLRMGMKYLKENASDYKDELDFLSNERLQHYPSKVMRPALGCRILAARNVSKLIPGVTHELTDWVDENRKKSSQLLYHLILNCEEKITMHCEPILHCLFKACTDENQIVIANVEKSAALIGYFVPLESIWPILSSAVKTFTHHGGLAILACVMQGAKNSDLKNYCSEILLLLEDQEMCQTFKPRKQKWILACCKSIIDKIGKELREDLIVKLFNVIVTVMALCQEQRLQQFAMDQLAMMKAKVCDLEKLDDLFAKYSGHLLKQIKEYDLKWNNTLPEKLTFESLLTQGGCLVDENIDCILEILLKNLTPDDTDAEVKLNIFTLLTKVVSNHASTDWLINDQRRSKMENFSICIVQDVLGPSLVWKAGKSASALRTAAISCLFAILNGDLLTRSFSVQLSETVCGHCVTLLDDRAVKVRLLACQCLKALSKRCERKLNSDLIHKIYPELLKRLDDEEIDIRLSACIAMSSIFKNVPEGYNNEFYRPHLEYAISTLLIHLDDEDADVQEAVLETLQILGPMCRDHIAKEAEACRVKHRSPSFCDILIKAFK